jgi:2-polyprenyl-3-methyl-5-hydroxy-6-metoxy-1,4-benzoquinol methylase
MKKNNAYEFFNSDYSVDRYTELYKKIRLDKRYPANVKRLEIFLNLLKKYKPKKIVDAGCGAGMPLITIKKKGFNITGYDKAKNMVEEAKKNLKNSGLSTNLIFNDDFENPKLIKDQTIDCILGMGAFFYAKDFKKTLKNQTKKLKKNGRMIFSLRNRLFDVATLNYYTKGFLDEVYETKKLKKSWKKKYEKLFDGFSKRKDYKIKNIDDEGVYSLVHNPLTISNELSKIGLKCEGLYFYHFHSLPPVFENFDQLYFRKLSWKMENPTDWRGFLLASGFVVDCKKI